METRPYLLHALSPLHAGTGQAADVIDLPIARLRSTGIPIVPGSSVKGVLRDARRPDPASPTRAQEVEEWLATFGPETSNAADHVGALVVGDARLLALPVRSFRGTFAWVSSPLLLDLARRDWSGAGGAPESVPKVASRTQVLVAVVEGSTKSLNVHGERLRGEPGKPANDTARVFLEELDFEVAASPEVASWATALARYIDPAGATLNFYRRFVVVDDEVMTFLWETATQIDTRVRLDADTRTVAKGALWVEESLPPETLLIGLLAAEGSRRGNTPLQASDVLDRALLGEEVLQFGGKATVGRGRCRILPLRTT